MSAAGGRSAQERERGLPVGEGEGVYLALPAGNPFAVLVLCVYVLIAQNKFLKRQYPSFLTGDR